MVQMRRRMKYASIHKQVVARFIFALLVVAALEFLSITNWSDTSDYRASLLAHGLLSVETMEPPVHGDAGEKVLVADDGRKEVDLNNQVSNQEDSNPPVHGNSGDKVVAKDSKEDQEDNSGIKVSSKFVSYLQTLGAIPRKVHVFFPDKQFVHKPDPTPMVKHGVLNLMKLNTNWNVTIYDDSDIDNIIRDATEILSQQERDILLGESDGNGGWKNGAHVVEKTDLARLILMYTQGGLYLDVDRVVNIKLDDLFGPETKMCMPSIYDANFMQDIMCSAVHNSLYLEVIKAQSKKRLTGGNDGGPLERRGGWARPADLFHMGPPTYNALVSLLLFERDKEIESKEIPEARTALEKSNGVIITKREEWCDGFLVRPYDGCKAVDRMALYNQYNLTRWSVAVKARWNITR